MLKSNSNLRTNKKCQVKKKAIENMNGSNNKIKIYINNKVFYTSPDKSILEVCLNNNIFIPHLCYDPRLKPQGACRLCVVEVEGTPEAVASCVTKIEEEIKIKTK